MSIVQFVKKVHKKRHKAIEHIADSRDHYYLGLSNEGFHRLYYREWGDPNNKETIICVHGLTRISRDFDELAQALGKKYRVVCPDIVGRGNSDWFGNKEHYNITQYCADINALIAHLRVEKVHFIGTSMGGLIGMLLAGMAHTPIQSFILNDVGPFIKRSELQTMGEYVGRAPIFVSRDELYDYFQSVYHGSCALLNKKQIKQMARYSSFKTNGGYRLHYDPKIGDAFRKNYTFFNFELWKYWEEIECPVMVLRGSESTFLTMDIIDKMANTHEDIKVIEIPQAGHTPLMKTESEINIVSHFFESVINPTQADN